MTTGKPKRRLGIIILFLIVVLCLAGCSSWELGHPNALEQDYGNSVRNNLAQSILNPGAGLNTTPTAGLSPNAAVNEMGHYDKGFKGEEKKPAEMKIAY
jgi:hypothetical protein